MTPNLASGAIHAYIDALVIRHAYCWLIVASSLTGTNSTGSNDRLPGYKLPYMG